MTHVTQVSYVCVMSICVSHQHRLVNLTWHTATFRSTIHVMYVSVTFYHRPVNMTWLTDTDQLFMCHVRHCQFAAQTGEHTDTNQLFSIICHVHHCMSVSVTSTDSVNLTGQWCTVNPTWHSDTGKHSFVIPVSVSYQHKAVNPTVRSTINMSCLSVSVTSTSQQRTWHLWYRLANLASQSVMAWVKVKKCKTKCPLQCSSL